MTDEAATVIDWSLASRLGRKLAGTNTTNIGDAQARSICAEALERVVSYSTLRPATAVPEVEVVAREEWIDSNLAELMKLVTPVEERLARDLSLPGVFAPLARRGLGAAAGAEAGVVVGYAAKRVLGQYQLSLRPEPAEPRLLLVGANLDEAAARLEVDAEPFLMWISIHEQTHSVQFHSVPWLRDHLAGLVTELMEAASGGLDLGAIVTRARGLVSPDPREGLRRILRGELARILAGPEQGRIMDSVQAAMAVVEGYAEHVMDEASADEPDLAVMRERMDARRAHRAGLADMIARVLGLGAKLRQYELGKAWCDAVASQAGITGLDRVWEGPDALPDLVELEDPQAWIDRVLTPATA